MKDIIYFIWYALKCGAGSSEGVRLLEYFNDVKEIYDAGYDELMSAGDFSPEFLNRFSDRDLSHAESILEFCFLNDIRIISCDSDDYPERLRTIYNKPIVLYLRGEIENLSQKLCIGVVGTRQMSNYGKHATFDIVRNLCSYGCVIVSGAAYGIDTVANNTALYFESETIAVLGSGIDIPYPYENKDMLDRIAEHGIVMSEYPPGTPPAGYNFPKRNRIISGLSDGLLVVEAGEKSGALITARRAADQGRYVYAVPGGIYQTESRGTNSLIRDGARLCMRAEDIVEDFTDRFKIERLEDFLRNEKYLRYEMRSKYREMAQSTESVKPAPIYQKEINKKEQLVKSNSTQAESELPNLQPEQKTTHKISNSRDCIYTKLNDIQKQVFDAMPDGVSILPDKLTETGLSAGDVMSSLTVLELYSAVEALPGGLYRKLV
jgi:DNA processing protein